MPIQFSQESQDIGGGVYVDDQGFLRHNDGNAMVFDSTYQPIRIADAQPGQKFDSLASLGEFLSSINEGPSTPFGQPPPSNSGAVNPPPPLDPWAAGGGALGGLAAGTLIDAFGNPVDPADVTFDGGGGGGLGTATVPTQPTPVVEAPKPPPEPQTPYVPNESGAFGSPVTMDPVTVNAPASGGGSGIDPAILGGLGLGAVGLGLGALGGGSSFESGGATATGTGGTSPVPTSTTGNGFDWNSLLGLLQLGGGLGIGTSGSGTTDPRNLTQEGTQMLGTQIQLAPEQLAAIQQYSGPYANNYLDIANTLGGGLGNLSSQLNTQNRTSTLGDVESLAPRYNALMKSSNPDYFNALDRFSNAALSAIDPSAAQKQQQGLASQGFGTYSQPQSQILDQQNRIAQDLLSRGGELSPTELRDVQQSSRAGFAARGLGGTNSSVLDEVLSTDAAKRNRLLENLGIAQNVQGQNLASNTLGLAGFQANSSNTAAQLQALQQAATLSEQQRQSQVNQQQAGLGLQQNTLFNPFSAITGATNENILPQSLTGTSGLNNFVTSNFNPFSGYGQDLFNTNFNQSATAATNNQNQNAALGSLLLRGGLSTLLGRNVFG